MVVINPIFLLLFRGMNFRAGDHLSRLSVLGAEFDQERAGLEAKVASDYGKASEVHAAEKTAMKTQKKLKNKSC